MRRGTTPTITVHITGETFADSTLYVTLRQGNTIITKKNNDIIKTVDGENCTLYVYFSQEETLSLEQGSAQFQIRWINSNSLAEATRTKTIHVDPVLLEGVIVYEP